MERQSYTGLLLVAAVAGAALMPRTAAPAGETEPSPKPSLEQQRLRPEPASSFWPILSDFLPPQSGGPVPIEQHPELLANAGFQFEHLIVTVPDPESTAYPHSFDETIESVRYAVEEEGYSFDRFWLPWRPKAQQDDKVSPPLGMPGLILFRQETGQKLLGVFLVGENPRSGLDKVAFEKAVDAIRGLNREAETLERKPLRLRVLGPTFSGSIFSLRMALLHLSPRLRERELEEVQVVSGSATSKDNAQRLNAGPKSKGDYGFLVSYSAMLENDERVLEVFSEYMDKIDPDAMIAFLTEYGTVFGDRIAKAARAQSTVARGTLSDNVQSLAGRLLPAWLKPTGPPRPETRWVVLRFPMDISGVRRAYLEDPELRKFWSGRKATEEPLPQLSVGGSTRTVGNIPTFAPEETSPAHDNTLRAMFAMLTRRSVDLVGIAATNTTDALFLAAIMQKYAPNARPFLLDADVLFLGSPHGVPMTGMLFATNYPLFLRNQSWTGSSSSRSGLRQFTSRYAEAIYNACQTAIGGQHLIEHAWPFRRGSDKKPPVWLTVAGTESFWPVALLDAGKEPKAAASGRRELPPLPRPSKVWTVLYFVLAGWCMVHAVAFVYHNYTAGQSDWMSVYWLDPNGEKQLAKRICLGLAAACLFVLLVSLGMIHLWASERREGLAARILTVALFAIPAGLLLANAVALAVPARIRFRHYAFVAGAFSLVSVIALPFIQLEWFDSDDLYGMFFIFRSLNPGNGVSPLMSVALLVVGLYSWAMAHVRRLRTWELRRACLPQLTADMTFAAGQAELADRLTRSFRDWIFCPRLFWITALFIVVSALTFSRWAAISTFERPWFNSLYETLLLALYAGVVLSMARFMAGWFALRRLLALLEWHPIRSAFGGLGEFSWTVLWKRGASRQTFNTTIASFERLRHIVNSPGPAPAAVSVGGGAAAQPAPQWVSVPGLLPAVAELEEGLTVILDRETRGLRPPVAMYRNLQEKMLAISHAFERTLLAPFWQQSRADTRDWTPVHQAAEDFVALRYVAYIRYAMLQLREQLEFVSTAFVVALLSFNMYPFEPHRSIMSAAAMLFVVVGACTVYVFMQMDRNALMSRLSQTKADKLDMNFVLRVASYGALPLLTLLGTSFPWAGQMFRSWVQPALDAMK